MGRIFCGEGWKNRLAVQWLPLWRSSFNEVVIGVSAHSQEVLNLHA
jgi:hypothetical protein